MKWNKQHLIAFFLVAMVLSSCSLFIIDHWKSSEDTIDHLKSSEEPIYSSQYSDVNNYMSINSTVLLSNSSAPGYSVYNLVDNDPNTYFETPVLNLSENNPEIISFSWNENITCSSFRYYYYNPSGVSFCPTRYALYDDHLLIYNETDTKPKNDAWNTIYFSPVTCTKLTWKIYGTYGGDPTQVLINLIDVVPSGSPTIIEQEQIPYFQEIPPYWNDLDWALSWHIDDVTNISLLPKAWLEHQPLTVMMMNKYINCPPSYITRYHVEYGSHSINHVQGYGKKGYNDWYNWVQESIMFLENKSSISLWSNKCISFAVPYSSGNPLGAKGSYDAGIRVMGNALGKSWHIRPPRNIGSSSNVVFPLSESDWMFVYIQGSKQDVKADWQNCLLQARQNKSFADMMMHQYHPAEKFDPHYYSFIENDTTGWHCTWGEIRSYYWYKKFTTLSYNESASNSTKKVFNVHIHCSDDRIWEVPITLKFDIPQWTGQAVVRWASNGTVYKDSWDDIGGFFPSRSLHTNQTMREGYRWDGRILCLSTKLKDKVIELYVRG
jgi:hypothetical protein